MTIAILNMWDITNVYKTFTFLKQDYKLLGS